MSLHIQDGWYVHRHSDGSVTIRKENGFGIVSELIVMTPEAWASVVAHVSPEGETTETFYRALSQHTGKKHDPATGGIVDQCITCVSCGQRHPPGEC